MQRSGAIGATLARPRIDRGTTLRSASNRGPYAHRSPAGRGAGAEAAEVIL